MSSIIAFKTKKKQPLTKYKQNKTDEKIDVEKIILFTKLTKQTQTSNIASEFIVSLLNKYEQL